MVDANNNPFSHPVTFFQDRRLPETGVLAGYAALMARFDLAAPVPHRLCAIGARHQVSETDNWRIYTPRHAPEPSVAGHLTFALKYEGVDLGVLYRLFRSIGPDPVVDMVQTQPTGRYARRVWFFYEWLIGQKLPLPDARQGNYVPALDPKIQIATEGRRSARHRVLDNMPGTPQFCPLVFRSPAIETALADDLQHRAAQAMGAIPRDVMARAAAFLLLNDSRASYAIEGERPPQDRIQRWGQAIGSAGQKPIDLEELLRLQRVVIGDARFVRLGLRDEGGFIGAHDRDSLFPLPDHISARPQDLPDLMQGLFAFDRMNSPTVHPVIAAAMLAFGFVYIHPFEDGNGRLHRYLLHHVLADRGFAPKGVTFPVSAVILDQIDRYRAVLETVSAARLPLIEWQETAQHNVDVRNDTADYYRYFDATPHAEFLFACVARTIDHELPQEAAFLARHDQFMTRLAQIVDMPDRTAELLFRFLSQNNGHLSTRAKTREFAALTDTEVQAIEAAWHAGQDI